MKYNFSLRNLQEKNGLTIGSKDEAMKNLECGILVVSLS